MSNYFGFWPVFRCSLACLQASLGYASIARLSDGQLHHTSGLLELNITTAHGLVLDLRGRVYQGALLRGLRMLCVSRACSVIRNGVLQLPDAVQLVFKARGCRMEGIVRGQGFPGLEDQCMQRQQGGGCAGQMPGSVQLHHCLTASFAMPGPSSACH